jgi:hypothetical protein
MIYDVLAAAAPMTPKDIQAAQQALEILQRVQTKVLVEMWTTIMLCAGMVSVCVAQLFVLLGYRRVAALFVGVFGYTMTWVPAAIAPWFGYGAIVLAVATIVKESMSGKDVIPSKASPAIA